MKITGFVFALLVLVVCVISPLKSAQSLAESDNAASQAFAVSFLDSLDDGQRMRAQRPFSDPLREDWHFVPKEREGVAIKQLTDAQRRKLDALLTSVLTPEGLEKARGAITLEGVLAELGGDPDHRDAGKYYTLVFGDPSHAEPWGFRFEGHHLSLSYTLIDGEAKLAITPAFIGANPHRVPRGQHEGLRVLATEEDAGRALVRSLSPAQREVAVISNRAPRDIVTGADSVARIDAFEGIRAGDLDADQQSALRDLINVYLNNHRPQAAEGMRQAIDDSGFAEVHFAWAGSLEPGDAHYYRIHGSTFVIEYDNIQDDANHSHTVLRDFQNDFGRDWLKEHHEHDH